MKKSLSMAFAAMLSSAPLAPALAVDIVNNDDQAHQVTIETSDGETSELEIAAGGKAAGVCDSCNISLEGQEPFPAENDDVVTIKDGELSN